MRKFTSALLLISILAALSACGGTEQPAADTTADTTPEETLSAFEQNVPKADFGGAKFRIVGRADGDLQSLHVYEMTAETENGDVINDAVYARNMKISDYLNVEIVCELSARNDVMRPSRALPKGESSEMAPFMGSASWEPTIL